MVLVGVKITPSGIPTSWESEIIVGFVKGNLGHDTWKKHDLSIQPQGNQTTHQIPSFPQDRRSQLEIPLSFLRLFFPNWIPKLAASTFADAVKVYYMIFPTKNMVHDSMWVC